MSSPKEPQNYGREVSKEVHNSTDGHTDVTKTTETINGSNAYKDGFVNGQAAESYQEDALVARDNENAGRGLLIGILVASLAAITAGSLWFLNQRDDVVNPVTPIVVPVPNRVEPRPSPEAKAPETKTTIIQKTREVIVPVPQQAAPKPQPSVAAPEQNINITVPPVTPPSPEAKQAPTAEMAPKPAAETAPKPAESNSSPDMQSPTPTEDSAGEDPAPNTDAPATNGSGAQ